MVVMDLLSKYKELSEDDKKSLYNYKDSNCIKDMLYLSVDMKNDIIDVALKNMYVNKDKKRELNLKNEELLLREGYDILHKGFYNSESFLGMLYATKIDKTINLKIDALNKVNITKRGKKALELLRVRSLNSSKNNSNAWLDFSTVKESKLLSKKYNDFLVDNFPHLHEYMLSEERELMLDSIYNFLNTNEDRLNTLIKTKLEEEHIKPKSDFSLRVVIYFKGFEHLLELEESFFALKRVYDAGHTSYIYLNNSWFFVPDTVVSTITMKYISVNRNNVLYPTGLLPLSDIFNYYELDKYKKFLYESYLSNFPGVRTIYLDKVNLKQKSKETILSGDFIINLYDSTDKGSIDFYSFDIYRDTKKSKLVKYYTIDNTELVLNDINASNTLFLKLITDNFLDSITYDKKASQINNFLDFIDNNKTPSAKLNTLYLRDGSYIINKWDDFGYKNKIISDKLLRLMSSSINIQCLENRKKSSLFKKLLLKLSIESDIKGDVNGVLTLEDKKNNLVNVLNSVDLPLVIKDVDEFLLLVGSILRYQLSFTSKPDSDKAIYITKLSQKKTVKNMNNYISTIDGRFHVTLTESSNYKKARIATLDFKDEKITNLDALWYGLYMPTNIIAKKSN